MENVCKKDKWRRSRVIPWSTIVPNHPTVFPAILLPMSSLFLDLWGNTIPQEQILGYGGSSVVVLCDGQAVKTSSEISLELKQRHGCECPCNSTRTRRAGVCNPSSSKDSQCDGIVDCIGLSREATRLAYLENGDLRLYLEDNQSSHQLQPSWFCEIAHTLGYIHGRRVLVADIASRNFPLDADLCLKFCDFSEASILPLDADMDTVDDNGFTTRMNIGTRSSYV